MPLLLQLHLPDMQKLMRANMSVLLPVSCMTMDVIWE
jgi:hypothetical protein